jgi:hypothetical protein
MNEIKTIPEREYDSVMLNQFISRKLLTQRFLTNNCPGKKIDRDFGFDVNLAIRG